MTLAPCTPQSSVNKPAWVYHY